LAIHNPQSASHNLHVPQVDLWAQQQECAEEIRAVLDAVMRESAFIFGRFVREFADAFAHYCETRHCIGVGNGTDALTLALRAAGVGPGDKVVTVPFTFASTLAAICHVGARSLLVDIDSETYTMSADALENLLRRERSIKAVLPVHLFGHPADMSRICALAADIGAVVIEDACQAHGARWQGKKVGSLGHIGCFSFYPTKNLGGMGDGGAVVTDDPALAQEIRLLANHGQQQKYEHTRVGWNSRLDGVQAAVLSVKLKRLDEWNNRRRQWAETYRRLLQGTALRLPREHKDAFHIYHLFVVRTSLRDSLADFLRQRQIQVSLHYPSPLHLQSAFTSLGYRQGDFPATEACARECLSLPLFPHLTEDQVAWVCESVREWEKS
jgi:dTDP-4-amino-4,6-dideoxygalactose transaminase